MSKKAYAKAITTQKSESKRRFNNSPRSQMILKITSTYHYDYKKFGNPATDLGKVFLLF